MSNPFYTASGAPVTGSPGASATIRSEFSSVAAGFDKLPGTLTANKAVVINAGGTAMTVTTGSLVLSGDFSTTGAFNTVFAQQASITITLPLTADTLVGRATTDTMSNKTFVAPALGTPASGNMSNCTAYPVASLSGLAANIATFLATPSSANLAAALTDETGTGANVFATSPTLVTPLLGTPTSGVLTNCTGYTLTNLASIGAGVATLLTGTSSGTGGPAGTASPTFTGTVGGAAATWTGNDTAAAFIPSGSTIPTNGIYLPAANRVGIAANSTNVMNITTTGVGIGMTAVYSLDIIKTQNTESRGQILNADPGASASARWVATNGVAQSVIGILGTSFVSGITIFNHAGYGFLSTDNGLIIATGTANPILVGINNVETARFISTGGFAIGANALSNATQLTAQSATASIAVASVVTTAANGTGPFTYRSDMTNANLNDTTGIHFIGTNTGLGEVIRIRSDGNITNQNNSYGATSMRDFKQDFEPAHRQWKDVKALAASLERYRLKSHVAEDENAPFQLGLITDTTKAISPGLVQTSSEGVESIVYSIVNLKMLQAFGEAQQRIEALEAEIAVLKGKIQ